MGGTIGASHSFSQLARGTGDTCWTGPSLEPHFGQCPSPRGARVPRSGAGSRRRTVFPASSIDHRVRLTSDPSRRTDVGSRSFHRCGKSHPPGSNRFAGAVRNSTRITTATASGSTGSAGLGTELGASFARGSGTDHRIASFDRLHDCDAGAFGAFVRAAT